MSAKSLAKVNMRGTADAYFEVYWLEDYAEEQIRDELSAGKQPEESNKSGDKRTGAEGPVFTTQVVKGSRNPEYDNEITLLEKPAGYKVSDTNIRIVGYSKGLSKTSVWARHDFWG